MKLLCLCFIIVIGLEILELRSGIQQFFFEILPKLQVVE
jgi:hypothetical protein